MPKKEFLMLAHAYHYGDIIRGYYASRKYNGFSVVWDGGITRGHVAEHVPWYKRGGDARLKGGAVMSTGLWSRRGKVVAAPKWFLDKLPAGIPLQGEMWKDDDRKKAAVVNLKDPTSPRWEDVHFVAYNIKPYELWSTSDLFIDWQEPAIKTFIREHTYKNTSFAARKKILDSLGKSAFYSVGFVAKQNLIMTERDLHDYYEKAMSNDWEGIMLINGGSLYEDWRSHNLLKVKPHYDHEATVVGYEHGKNRHEGRMGSLIVELTWGQEVLSFHGGKEKHIGETVRFNIGSGFDDYEREWEYVEDHYPTGSQVEFNFTEVGANGAPPSASFKKYI